MESKLLTTRVLSSPTSYEVLECSDTNGIMLMKKIPVKGTLIFLGFL
jgi:hypothetical protein